MTAKRTQKNEVRIGIVGVGGMGSSHARLILDGKIKRGRLTAICDIDPKQFEKFKESDLKTFTDSRELIRSGEVDAVIVATPHYAHTTVGIDALTQGLHLLVEKPISVHKADCEKLIKAYTQRPHKKQVFAAMFNQRTDPKYKKVKQLIDDGELGEITRVNWIITDWFRTQRYYDSGGWRATWEGEGGGVLLNQCPHQLDLLQWICGKPTRIQAHCGIGRRHHIEAEDEVTAYLEYANGATGVFITSTGEAPGTNRLEISGERGKIVVENNEIRWTRNEVPMGEWSKSNQELFSKPAVWNIEVPTSGSGTQHQGIMQNVVEAILDGAKLIAPASEGIHSVEIGNAMLLSSLTGKTIDMPMSASVYARQLRKLIRESTFKKKAVKPAKAVDMSSSF